MDGGNLVPKYMNYWVITLVIGVYAGYRHIYVYIYTYIYTCIYIYRVILKGARHMRWCKISSFLKSMGSPSMDRIGIVLRIFSGS